MTQDLAKWTVLVPVKSPAVGKSRLKVTDAGRQQIARAIALDTIDAVLHCDEVGRVIVVTTDDLLRRDIDEELDVEVLTRPPRLGLDGALAAAADVAGTQVPRAAIVADLPALCSTDLGWALRESATSERAVVADTDGVGTTMVAVRAGVTWMSCFGADSFARHIAAGFTPLADIAVPTLRRDVDTVEDLQAAVELLLGSRTAATCSRLGGSLGSRMRIASDVMLTGPRDGCEVQTRAHRVPTNERKRTGLN